MIKRLITLANDLDGGLFKKEADIIDNIVKNYINANSINKLAISIEQSHIQFPNDKAIIDMLYQHDHTGNKALFNFFIKEKIKDGSLDLNKCLDLVHAFQESEFKNKLRLQDKSTDINTYKGKTDELFKILTEIREMPYASKQDKRSQKAINEEKIYDSPEASIYILKNKAAVCQFSGSSNWCVTSWSTNTYEDYVIDNVIFYLIVNKNGIAPNDKFLYSINKKYEDIQIQNSNQSISGKEAILNAFGNDEGEKILNLLKANAKTAADTEYFTISQISNQEKLKQLSTSGDVGVRTAVAMNGNLSKDIFSKLLHDKDDNVVLAALENLELNKDLIDDTIKSHENEKIRFIAFEITGDTSILPSLYNTSDTNILYTIGINNSTSPEMLNILSKNPSFSVRRSVARNVSADPATLNLLAHDSDLHVRVALAKNPFIPIESMYILAKDLSPSIQYALAGNKNLPPDILNILSMSNDKDIVRQVAENVNTSNETLRRLVAESHYYNIEISMNANLSSELLKILSEDYSSDVRYGIAIHEKTTADILMALSSDPVADIRFAVCSNPNVDMKTLKKLTQDSDEGVKRTAILRTIHKSL